MKSNTSTFIIFGLAALLLAVPFVAMQFTSEVNWDLPDFLVMGFLVIIFASGINFVWKKTNPSRKKIFYIVLILLIFILIWAELAVGIFGSSFAGN